MYNTNYKIFTARKLGRMTKFLLHALQKTSTTQTIKSDRML